MKPTLLDKLNALDELEQVFQIIFCDEPGDYDETRNRMRRALAILHALEKAEIQ